ncbi:MAG TPA: glycosyltransferase family 4 protein [Pirellulales bacterium]|nr:glycosyltransferase family 4 protein [Pirellulales bacterium]
MRLAIVVSHPIQYNAPIYRLLARHDDVELKVFYTWFNEREPIWDSGFQRPVAWDIPLTEGYPYQAVPNVARHPGTDHFFGLRNPQLVQTVVDWQPDVVHLTGYAYLSHLQLMRSMSRRGIPLLFRGDSHLLRPGSRWKRSLREVVLRRIYRWPAGFLYVGVHNREYYRAFGVPEHKLFYCPHSIEVERFAEPADALERRALDWRRELAIGDDRIVLLFAGKLQPKKQPVELMRAVVAMNDPRLLLIVVGDGVERPAVDALAAAHPDRFRLLPFQNQSVMPVVYRLGDLFVLPSMASDETWGLAVNEAMACRRPVVASDLVGSAPDMVQRGTTGEVFHAGDWADFREKTGRLLSIGKQALAAMGRRAGELSAQFSPQATESHLISAAKTVLVGRMESVSVTLGSVANPLAR